MSVTLALFTLIMEIYLYDLQGPKESNSNLPIFEKMLTVVSSFGINITFQYVAYFSAGMIHKKKLRNNCFLNVLF